MKNDNVKLKIYKSIPRSGIPKFYILRFKFYTFFISAPSPANLAAKFSYPRSI